ncbi:MAG: beta-propeller domain-containing protein [Candidatus Peribacteria bacterium]|nr:MAG: beta-propeller domain-containing protein [Candidatus Peribacteria bacterium]
MPLEAPMMGGMADDVAVDAIAMDGDQGAMNVEESYAETKSSSSDFSTTNIQVAGVDEADILKTDGEYLYYYNQRLQQISILKSPLDLASKMIDLDNAEVITVINIPSTFYDVQMYIRDGELVVIGQRRSQANYQGFLDRGNRTDVIVYDISNIADPEIVKFSDLDGNYLDSRVIGDKLYVVSQLQANRWYPYMYRQEGDDTPVVFAADEVLPKAIDIAYTTTESEKNLVIGERTLPYRVSIQRTPCDEVFYVLPSDESLEQIGMYPSFTVVRVIDLASASEEVETKVAIGSTETVHMSEDALYLANPFYVPYVSKCPANARCIMPWYDQGQHTLVHKFDINSQQ